MPNKPFAERSFLVAENLYQLAPVNAGPIYAASLDFEHPTSYIMKDFWGKYLRLLSWMRQREDKFFIDVLNKIHVGGKICGC